MNEYPLNQSIYLLLLLQIFMLKKLKKCLNLFFIDGYYNTIPVRNINPFKIFKNKKNINLFILSQ